MRKNRDYLDIPRDEMFFALAVNQVYSGQYVAICSSGIFSLRRRHFLGIAHGKR